MVWAITGPHTLMREFCLNSELGIAWIMISCYQIQLVFPGVKLYVFPSRRKPFRNKCEVWTRLAQTSCYAYNSIGLDTA